MEVDDGEMQAALAMASVPPFAEVIVAPAGLPRTKPRALNMALSVARGTYTVVYDAEDVPDPDQLRLAVAGFARQPPQVACLQARLVIDNVGDGWLARCLALEYGALFDVVNPAIAAQGWPMLLGGTSNHFRTRTLQELGGWDAWNVTEDADLGLRLARAGFRVADLPSATLEEAPDRFGAWLRQRSRWMKGYMQTCIVHGRHPLAAARALGPGGTLAALAQCLGTVLTALLFPVLAVPGVIALASGEMLAARAPAEIVATAVGSVLLVSGALAMLGAPLLAVHRRRWWGLLPIIPTLPAYYALISIAAWRALWELFRQPHHWHKTEHGRARSSRSGRLTLMALSAAASEAPGEGRGRDLREHGRPLPPPQEAGGQEARGQARRGR